MDNSKGPLFALGSLAVAAAALAFIAFGNLGQNLVYYWSPTELHEAGISAQGATIRLGGVVEPGSVSWIPGEAGSFRITDGQKSVMVSSSGMPPQMFREGIGVVVEGSVKQDGKFYTERVLVKHGNEYRAPEDGEAMDVEALYNSMDKT